MDKQAIGFLLVSLFNIDNALYFHMQETERKCFIEEIPQGTLVIVNYKMELYDPRSNGLTFFSPGIGIHVEVRDPDDKVIRSGLYNSEGRIFFHSQTPGEYTICIDSNSTTSFSESKLRVHLDMRVGVDAINYGDIVHKDKLELRIRQLLEQVEQISREQNYQRYREERFRQMCESTNSRVFWWPFLQTGILLMMSTWPLIMYYILKKNEYDPSSDCARQGLTLLIKQETLRCPNRLETSSTVEKEATSAVSTCSLEPIVVPIHHGRKINLKFLITKKGNNL